LPDKVGLIKIDAEGHEIAVLNGAKAVIERFRPAVTVEADEHRHKPGCVGFVRQFFSDRGYAGFYLEGRKLTPMQQFNPSVHQNKAALDENGVVIFGRTYVGTFVFVGDAGTASKLASLGSL
jgi:hypothetical protein